VAARREVMAKWHPGSHGGTYGGNAVACAAAVATIEAMRDEGILERVKELGEQVVRPRLEKIRDAHPSVGDVRGLGLFWAIELVRDRTTREPLAPYGASSPEMNQLVAACKSRGLLPFANFNRIHVVPPCNTGVADTEAGLAILDDVLDIADGFAA
jgi:taurine--2-oxoglutarate transaminase